jgi:predicted DNA-binding transcriptional regulator AlpA
MSDRLIKSRDAAKLLACSSSWMQAMVRKGLLSPVRLPGGRGKLRFRQSDIDQIIAGTGPGAASRMSRPLAPAALPGPSCLSDPVEYV